MEYIKIVLTGAFSEDLKYGKDTLKMAAINAFQDCYTAAGPVIIEPIMLVEVIVPREFQGNVADNIKRRNGVIVGNYQDVDCSRIQAHVRVHYFFFFFLQSIVL